MKTFTLFCAHMEDVNTKDCNDLPKESEINLGISVVTCKSESQEEAYERLTGFAGWCDKIFFTFEDHLSIMVEDFKGTPLSRIWDVDKEGSPFYKSA